MKRYIFTLAVAMLAIMTVSAEDLTGLKVYINPGHGGYDANDRSCWTIPVPETWSNPEGYWESKSNLVKALALRDLLEAAGAEVIMSRTTNTSGARDLDYYPNATPEEKEQIRNGDDRSLSAIAEEANANGVDHFLSVHSNALNGQTNYLLLLYRGYTGTPQTAPSDLMAASSGNMQIQNALTVWTSPNPIMRGDLTFYGDGLGLGVLRPLTVPGFLSEGSFHDYAPETHRLCNDDYCKLEAERIYQHICKFFERDLPQNAIISGWVKSNNEKVDVLGHSKFVYVPESDDQWLPLNGATVRLLDQAGNALQTVTTDDWYNGIFAFYDVAPGTYKVEASKEKYATVTMDVEVKATEIAGLKMRLDNIRLDVEDYPEPAQDEATMPLSDYEFQPEGESIDLSADLKRVVYRQGEIFALTADGQLLRYATNGTPIGSIALPEEVQLSDIAFTADDYLVAFQYQGTQLSVYSWNKQYTEPILLFTKDLGQAGTVSSFAVSGPRWNSEYYLLADKEGKSSVTGIRYNEDKPAELTVKTLTTDKLLAGAQLMIMPSGQIYADSPTVPALAFTFDWQAADEAAMLVEQFAAEGYTDNLITCGATFFRYAKHTYMAMPVAADDNSKVGFRLFDITDGFAVAKSVSAQYPEAGMGTAPANYTTAMASVSGYDMYVYLLAAGEGYQVFKSLSAPIANIYAGEVSLTEQGLGFRLNENATSVLITIEREGETIDSHELGAMDKGYHLIENPFKDIAFDALSITASARTVAYPVKISNDDPLFQYYSPRGVAVDRTPSSPYFGRIYVAESVGGTISEGAPAEPRTTTKGVYAIGADFTDVTEQGNQAWTGNVEWGDNGTNYQNALSKPTVAPDGDVFVTSTAFTSSGIYIMNPAEPAADFVPLFEGRRNKDTGSLKNGTTLITNPVMHCLVLGTGKDEVLYTYDRDNSLGTAYCNIHQYNIGQVEALPWQTAPSAVLFNDQATGSHMQNGSGQLAYDQRGGFFMSQYRYNSSVAVPALIHTTNGVLDFNIGTQVDPAQQGGMAVSADGNLLAMGEATGVVQVFDVTYNEQNVPALTKKYAIDWGNGKGNTIGIDFDAAGNLYIVSNSNERLMVYALPKPVNSYTTRIVFKNEVEDALDDICQEKVAVYPNPAHDVVTVSGEALQSYTIFDLTGHALLSGSLAAAERVDVSTLAAGMYILQVRTLNGDNHTVSLLKQ